MSGKDSNHLVENEQEISERLAAISIETPQSTNDVQIEPCQECAHVKERLEQMTQSFQDQLEINQELRRVKDALSDEIVELTKSLFEEANGMVAAEARARNILEVSRKKLESELTATKEHLRLEKEQLLELREKIFRVASRESAVMACDSPTLSDDNQIHHFNSSNFYNILQHSYFPDLLPSLRVDSRQRKAKDKWEEINDQISGETWKLFNKFVEDCSVSGPDFQNSFVKEIIEHELVPLCKFDYKPKAFLKKLFGSLLANKCSVESVGSEADFQKLVDNSLSVNSYRLRGYLDQFTSSVSSLPDTLLHYNSSPISSNDHSLNASTDACPPPKSSTKSTSFCSLCGEQIHAKHFEGSREGIFKMKLSDNSTWNLIDEDCRQRIVVAGHFFTFLRHLKDGHSSSRPVIDLYYDLLHIRRCMWYISSGSTAFFLQSDLERYLALIKQHSKKLNSS